MARELALPNGVRRSSNHKRRHHGRAQAQPTHLPEIQRRRRRRGRRRRRRPAAHRRAGPGRPAASTATNLNYPKRTVGKAGGMPVNQAGQLQLPRRQLALRGASAWVRRCPAAWARTRTSWPSASCARTWAARWPTTAAPRPSSAAATSRIFDAENGGQMVCGQATEDLPRVHARLRREDRHRHRRRHRRPDLRPPGQRAVRSADHEHQHQGPHRAAAEGRARRPT
ncbi:MAG: hypothetical protein MZU91_12290 [Desulfosudis oleivorans]|nr:hypothetical protein [Desulfosudis oleivorans]